MKTHWLALAALLLVAPSAHADKLRDLVEVEGARDNQLLGYGIVTGLSGTGDDITVPFAQQTLLNLLRRLGIQVDPSQMQMRNVAAVLVTASLPAFAKPGTKLDVTVSSIGNARSIAGGVLVQTVLKGADQRPYAVAQGSVIVGNFDVRGGNGTSVQRGVTSVAGRVPEGALVEREVGVDIGKNGTLRLDLRSPGFTVAARVAEAINQKLGAGSATAEDGGAIAVKMPAGMSAVQLVATLEEIEVTPVRKAKVVINERTGTIVAGGDVRLAPAAVVHGGLTIVVREQQQVSQPHAPFGKGTTAVVQNSEVEAKDDAKDVKFVPGAATLADVASAMEALGLPPRELGSVLEALRAAGVLEAEVVVQ